MDYSDLLPMDKTKSNIRSFDESILIIQSEYGNGNGSSIGFTLGSIIRDYQQKVSPRVFYPGDGWRAPLQRGNGLRFHAIIPQLEKAEKEIAELKTELTNANADFLAAEEKERKTREEQEQLQAENERQKEELASLKAELDALKKKQKEDAERPFFQKLRSLF